MIKIFTLFTLFIVGPVLSSNITAENSFKKDIPLSAHVSSIETITARILENLKDYQEIPNKDIIQLAISGYFDLLGDGKIKNGSPLSIIDFSLPSSSERLWILDMEEEKLLHHSLVSHGRNSGNLMAKKFSNVNSSFMSSVGFYVTGETYQGKHGYSLRLDGLEEGFNDNARERAIVIHGADYASEDFVKTTGRLGRSLGCPALPMDLHEEIIDTIKEGSCLFIFGNDPSYLSNSPIINGNKL